MALHVIWLGFLPVAQASILGTEGALALDQREARLIRINTALTREDVQREMLKLGVEPGEVRERVAALSDQELQQVEGQLDALPAGGSIAAAIGIVFIVLIILELVGVTNIFNRL
jgi:hypothetical protein